MKKWMLLFWLVSYTATYKIIGTCADQIDPSKEDRKTGEVFQGEEYIDPTSKFCEHRMEREQRFDTKQEAEKFIEDCPKEQCADIVLEEVNL